MVQADVDAGGELQGPPIAPGQLLHHADAGTQPGFNRSKQHPDRGGGDRTRVLVDGQADRTASAEIARSTADPPRAQAVVLAQVAVGMTSEDAAITVGVSGPVGSRWFRKRGRTPSISSMRLRAGTCHSLSVGRSRSSRPRTTAFVQSPVGSIGRRRRYRAS